MSKKMIVIRQLDNLIPVVAFIFDYSDIPADRDVPDDYAFEKCQELITDFMRRFPEFKNAKYYIQTVEVLGNECQHKNLQLIHYSKETYR